MRLRAALVVILLSGCLGSSGGSSGTEVEPTLRSNWPLQSNDLLGSRAAPFAGLYASNVADLGLSWRFDTDGAVTGTPTVVDDRVIFGTWQGSVYALDALTGELQWHRDHGAQVDSSVAQWGGMAYVSDMAARLTALDARTGDEAWSVLVDDTTSAHLYSSPVIVPDIPLLLIGVASDQESIPIHGDKPLDFRGKVVAYDPRTGDEVWRQMLVPENHTGAPVWGGLVVADDKVIFGTGNAYTEPAADTTDAIVALDLHSGEMLWKYQTINYDVFTQANPINPDHDFGSTPSVFAVDDRMAVGIGQKSSEYWAADIETGEIVWKHGEVEDGEGIIGDSAYWNGTIMVNHATLETTTAIDTAGATIWQHQGDGNLFSNPAIIPGAAITGDGAGMVKAFDLADGELLWHTMTGAGGVFGGISVASKHVFVPTVGEGFRGDSGAVLAYTPGGSGESEGGAEPTEGDVELRDFQFFPETLTIAAGETVRWVNTDGIYHTATSGWDNGTTFDFELPGDGDAADWTFDEPGTYEVYCKPHAFYDEGWQGMVQTILVE